MFLPISGGKASMSQNNVQAVSMLRTREITAEPNVSVGAGWPGDVTGVDRETQAVSATMLTANQTQRFFIFISPSGLFFENYKCLSLMLQEKK
jgi:hypothetical protein